MRDREEFGEYTHWKDRKTFQEEKRMIEAALEKGNDASLRAYLRPLVIHWFEEYRLDRPLEFYADEKVLEAGFRYLKEAVEKYAEKLKWGKVGYKFSTYFEWFIRQGFLDTLK